MTHSQKLSVMLGLFFVTALNGGPAFAQTGGDATSSPKLEEIIVTAQRREQSLQEVPISITALSGAAIERSGIQTTQDLTLATPGLTMTTTRNGMTPYLRGIGTSSGFIDGSVAVYVDNVYYSSTSGSLFGLNNVERVEILKGPQGTLFGRSATGGLVHVITRDPSDTPELRASVGFGNYDTKTGSLYANGAIAPGVSMNLALYGNWQDEGWGRNLFLGNDVNVRNEWSARSKLKFELGEKTTVVLSGDYAWNESDMGSMKQPVPGSIALGGSPHMGSIYDVNSNLPFDASNLFGSGMDSYQYGGSGVITHEFSDDITLTSTTAYRRFRTRSYLDNDLTPAAASDAYFEEPARSFQQEILLNGHESRFDWTAGGIYYESRTGYDPIIITSSVVPPANFHREAPVWVRSYALFGQGSYQLTDATTLTLGARYTIDKTHIKSVTYALPGNFVPAGAIIAAAGTDGQPHSRTHAKWEEPTWRLALDHKVNSNLLVYASYNRGYKAGAFNPSQPPSLLNQTPVNGIRDGDAVDPEKLDAYEVGLKSDLLDDQLRFNASAFYYDYTDIQITQLAANGTSINLFNAGAAEIKGLELETVAAPRISTGRLELRAAVSYLDAEYTEAVNVPRTTPRTGPPWGNITDTLADASGNHVIKTPEFSSTVGLDYWIPVGSDYEAGLSVNWLHTGRIYWEVDNRLSQSPIDIVNAQLSLGHINEVWRIRLWARNLTDEEYFTTVQSGNNGDSASPAAPRTYGLTLDLKF